MSIQFLDSEKLYYSFLSGAQEVIKNKRILNEINVFPVSDGDTGSNLAHTMNAILSDARMDQTVEGTMNSIADAALTGARGNSGIIMAQYINGIFMSLPKEEAITMAGFAALGLLAAADAPAGSGLVLGEAVAGMLLCAADDSIVAGDSGWRIAGSALGVDGHSPTGPAPDGARIAAVLDRALRAAALAPADIDLLKPHCGGLAATDEAEARALATVFGTRLPAQMALKPYLGHTLGASGMAETTALLGALAAAGGDARRVLLNLIGFGGSIAALALTRAAPPR